MKSIIHNTNPIILGIDPGYGRIGIAILEKSKNGEKILYSECFETAAKLSHETRLLLLSKKIEKIIEEYDPKEVALETLLWSKNHKTAMKVAEARGVILLEAAKKNIAVREFNPNQVKLAVTGYGKSDKKQVISMVEKIIKLEKKKRHDDEYDAIAIALTCSAISTTRL